jgi:outer membrane protein TolC
MNLIILILLFLNISLFSQNKLNLTLKSAIQIAIESSPNASIINEIKKQREMAYKSFQANLYPQLSLDVNAPGAIREINQITQNDGTQRFLQQTQLFSSAGLSLSQNIPFLGTDITIFSGLTRLDILEPASTQLWRTTPIQFSINQPIFAFNGLYWEKELQNLRKLNIDKQYIEEFEELAIRITNSFFDLYLAKMNLDNATKNVSANDSLFTISKGRFEVGRIAENDLLQSELALLNAKNNVETFKIEFDNSKARLRIILNLDKNTEIELDEPNNVFDGEVDFELAYFKMLENNSDVISFLISEKEAERELDRARKNNNFNANISMSYGLNQSATQFDLAYQNLLDRERLNVGVSIPILDWGRREANYESALANLEQTKINIELNKQNLEQEVKYTALRLNQLRDRVRLSENSVLIAEKRLDLAKNRFLIGKIDLNDFFIAQNEKDNAFFNYINSLRDYWNNYYRLRRLTLYDFERNRNIEY